MRSSSGNMRGKSSRSRADAERTLAHHQRSEPPATIPIRFSLHGTLTLLWAFAPLLTLGLAAAFVFPHAASRIRSRVSYVVASVYVGMVITWVVLAVLFGSQAPGALDEVGTVLILVTMFVGTGHALMLRHSVFYESGLVGRAKQRSEGRRSARGSHLMRERKALREEARALAAGDPILAKELGIGRPDRRTSREDGGLVDVNHANRKALRSLPGVSGAEADQIIERRDRFGPFASCNEFLLEIEILPSNFAAIEEYAIFIP